MGIDIKALLQSKVMSDELMERIANKLRKKKLINFSQAVWPEYEVGLHHTYIADILERAMKKEKGFTRLVLHEPPQHGKSLQVTELFPAFYIGNNPDHNIIITAYSDDHAQSFSRNIKNVIDSPEYQKIFPGIHLSEDSKAKSRWALNPPHKGGMVASGLEGRITGVGAELLIIDDPYKNREQAESKAYCDFVIETYKSSLRTRVHKNGIIILPMTRWTIRDLANFLIKLEKESFRYIRLPALSEGKDKDPLGRPELTPLWPSHYPQKELINIRDSVGEYNWNSMYQGNPVPLEGSLFKRSHFQIIDRAPKGLQWFRYWDLATSEDRKSDRTASGRGAVDDEGRVYIDGVMKGNWNWPEVRRKIKETALHEYGCMVGIEAQGIQKGMVQECWSDSDLVNVGIIGIPVSQSKRIRALPVMARGESGKLFIVRGPWNEEYIQEHVDFDLGEHDDQVDFTSGIFQMIGYGKPGVVDLNDFAVDADGEVIDKNAADLFYGIDDDMDLREEMVTNLV